MGALQNFEHRLEQAISGAFAKAFRSAVQPVEIAAALQRECDNNAQILSRNRRLVPNRFHVELSEGDLQRLAPYDSAMGEEMRKQLQEHADTQGYTFPGPVHIDFESAEDLTTGRFRIRSEAQARVRSNATRTQVGRATALVEVNSTRHPLHPGETVVGRGSDADIRINDPGVSRKHIQFEVAGTGESLQVGVRDLGSTNGMLVDGHRVTTTRLREGSQVKIGSTTLTVRIVSEDADV